MFHLISSSNIFSSSEISEKQKQPKISWKWGDWERSTILQCNNEPPMNISDQIENFFRKMVQDIEYDNVFIFLID